MVAQASGASRSRISAGVAELESGPAPLKRVRRECGGRKTGTATDPALLIALLALVEPTRRGDPESSQCWMTLSTRKLAGELTGHRCVDGSPGVGESGGMHSRRSRPPVQAPSAFAGFRFPPGVILLASRWYLRYSPVLPGSGGAPRRARYRGGSRHVVPVGPAIHS